MDSSSGDKISYLLEHTYVCVSGVMQRPYILKQMCRFYLAARFFKYVWPFITSKP